MSEGELIRYVRRRAEVDFDFVFSFDAVAELVGDEELSQSPVGSFFVFVIVGRECRKNGCGVFIFRRHRFVYGNRRAGLPCARFNLRIEGKHVILAVFYFARTYFEQSFGRCAEVCVVVVDVKRFFRRGNGVFDSVELACDFVKGFVARVVKRGTVITAVINVVDGCAYGGEFYGSRAKFVGKRDGIGRCFCSRFRISYVLIGFFAVVLSRFCGEGNFEFGCRCVYVFAAVKLEDTLRGVRRSLSRFVFALGYFFVSYVIEESKTLDVTVGEVSAAAAET